MEGGEGHDMHDMCLQGTEAIMQAKTKPATFSCCNALLQDQLMVTITHETNCISFKQDCL